MGIGGKARAPFLFGVSMMAVVAGSSPAAAQTQTQPGSALPTPQASGDTQPDIVVTGEAYSVERAIRTKRNLGIVSDSISASEIGAIPEFGLGEALQRVPGVSFQINNGRGEAQFMTLRGLNPDYNSTTLDGIQLPSTEESRRQFSFDVIPSIVANEVNVYKTYRADLPSDAIGGVTNLRTHSAFDHPGVFIAGHLDVSYWENERKFHQNVPSGQGDLRMSSTFGPDDSFGAVVLVSYYRRSSNSLNSYSLPYSYYNYAGGTQTVSATPLNPTADVTGLTPVPDRRRWYFYDNIRDRPGAMAKLEYRHAGVRAHIESGFFQHRNNEYRYSQYVNRGAATANFTSAGSATFAGGTFETDFDRYVQYRNIRFAEGGIGYDFDPATRIDATFNYARGFYRQNTTEDVFPGTPGTTYTLNYVGNVNGIPLLQPANLAAFTNPANYTETYHLNAVDSSTSRQPQFRIDLVHADPATDQGLQFGAGYLWKRLKQTYYYNEYRLNPLAGQAPTLAQVGALSGTISPADNLGNPLLFVDPDAVAAYIAAHPSAYAPAASNAARSTANNFTLAETVNAAYAEASYRAGPLYLQGGIRYEWNKQDVQNYVPSSLTSTADYTLTDTRNDYNLPLPEANLSYDLTRTLKFRAAVSRTVARPRYSDLAQNQSLTLSGTQATETIANPGLKTRRSWNYDLSLEWYPSRVAAFSIAAFEKDISDEIFTLTTVTQNVSLPGQIGNNYTLTLTEAVNAGKAKIRGLELGANIAKFSMLPGFLSNFGATANLTFVDFDAPTIQMSDRVTYRQLPQLLESSKFIANAALFYHQGRFSGEVAYNHTSAQPLSFDRTNPVNDQWYRTTDTFDAQIAYRIMKGLEFRIQGKNLTNETNQKVVGPNYALNYSLLNNGRAYYAGIGFAF